MRIRRSDRGIMVLCLHCISFVPLALTFMECLGLAYGFGFANTRSRLAQVRLRPRSSIHAPLPYSSVRPSVSVTRMSSANEDGVSSSSSSKGSNSAATSSGSATSSGNVKAVSPTETTTTAAVINNSNDSDDDDGGDNSDLSSDHPKNHEKLDALQQAEKLRQRAQQLKEEANAAEVALRSIQAKKLAESNNGTVNFLPYPVAGAGTGTGAGTQDPSISNASQNGNGNADEKNPLQLENYINETFGISSDINLNEFNMTKVMGEIIQVPLWVPSSILPFLVINPKPLKKDDLKRLRSDVLNPSSQFRVISSDAMKFAAVYRGTFVEERQASSIAALSSGKPMDGRGDMNNNAEQNLSRGSEEKGTDSNDASSSSISSPTASLTTSPQLSEIVFQDIQERLKESGLSDKIQLFLMEDPEWRPGDREEEPLPAILAVSTQVMPEQTSESGSVSKLITGFSIISTIFATFAYAVSGYALNPQFFHAIVDNSDASAIGACLPIFFGVWSLSLLHEVAHYIVAKASNVKIGLPVPIPSLQIGTFGSITPLRSFPKSRTALFDVAISGPLVTALASIGCMVAGIIMTVQTSAADIANLATIPVALLKTSFLVGSITSVMAPKVMTLPLSQPVPIHPLFLIGFAGLIVSALNLLPIGRLDGGRACSAVLGRRSAYLVSFSALLFLAIAALTQTSAVSIFFGLIVTIFQRNADIPVRDELSEVDDTRVGVYIFSIVLTVLTLAPFPGGLPI